MSVLEKLHWQTHICLDTHQRKEEGKRLRGGSGEQGAQAEEIKCEWHGEERSREADAGRKRHGSVGGSEGGL